MAVTADALRSFPALASYSNTQLEPYIEDAEMEVDSAVWGDFTDRGVKYLAAHLAYVGLVAGPAGGGPVQSESLGDASVSYAVKASADSDLARTAWGVEFMRLKKRFARPKIRSRYERHGWDVPDEAEESE